MNKLTDILTARNVFRISLFVAAVILLLLAPKAAVNVDEMLHYPHAKRVVNWYFTGGEDVSCLNTPVHNLKYYGQSVDNLTALINRVFSIENEFLTRHFTGAVFFFLLLLFAGLLGKELTGSYWVAATVVLSLMLTPRLFGQAFGNLKDIPFAAGYVAGICFIIKYLKQFPKVNWKTVIGLGLAIAFTCSVRIGGLILFAYLALGIVVLILSKPFLLKYIVSTKSCFVRLMGQWLVIVLAGYFLGLLFWPYALHDVVRHPLESLSVMEHYKISIKQLFEGEVIWSSSLPWHYLIKWILIATPEFVLLGILYFGAFLTYKFSKPLSEQLSIELFVFFTLLFPVVYVIVIGANLYSGMRQMLFVIPVMVVLAVTGLFQFAKLGISKKVKIPAVALFFLLMILPFQHQAKTFPADYIYFNAISGGNKAAWSNYEYDYYFHGMKEATDYLIAEIGDKEAIVAMNCQLPNYFEKLANIDFQYTRYLERSSVDWDYALFGVNYIHPYLLKNDRWQSCRIVKTFYHKGNPLVVLLERQSKDDFKGIDLLKHRHWDEAEVVLKKELETDPNNVWLFVNLANLKLAQRKYAELDELLADGRAIHPYYEPLYLIEAQKFFDQGKFDESFAVLNELIEVNPRYKNAAALLKKVKEKLNK
ncbi:phospholipid carrier-dependent glycosyltransferase [Draconibacterium orientale]|uniref:tetratricopeptide repeat protein n=1 Tax=Draconibacterium orientale TaxID=1168034 RepID=UPI0029C094EE|nr:phospholipid carrier-dependent glycosyltransferase [Draconibacterium orientale]